MKGLGTVDVSGTLHWTPAVGSKANGTEASRNKKGQAMCPALLQKERTAVSKTNLR
jgi:hypothetical protein